MSKVLVLSGAGISAESGISTFRDSDGLWEEYSVEDICTVGCLVVNREETIEFYDKRRLDLTDKKPNHAHKVLAELKNRYPDEIEIITQNVDDLFEKAGVAHKDVVHLHGYLTDVECEDCGFIYNIGYTKLQENNEGVCPHCNSPQVRPFIVMFGEPAPMYEKLSQELQDCELIVVIGTSGNVISVNGMANFIHRSILNNLEPSNVIEDELFDIVLYKKASEAIDEISQEIQRTILGSLDV
jgi:NAD-dependent deacetylase